MKKFIVLSAVALLAACAQLSEYANTASSGDSVKAKMTSCLLTEGNTRLQSGTLFTNTIRATADDMVKTCAKRLAFGSMGINSETQSVAENIITNLRNTAAAQ